MGIPTYWSTDTGLKELIKTTGTACDYIERNLPTDSYIKNSVVLTKQLANDTIGHWTLFSAIHYFSQLTLTVREWAKDFFSQLSSSTPFSTQSLGSLNQAVKHSKRISELSKEYPWITLALSTMSKFISWPLQLIKLHAALDNAKMDPYSEEKKWELAQAATSVSVAAGTIFLAPLNPVTFPVLSTIGSLLLNTVAHAKKKEYVAETNKAITLAALNQNQHILDRLRKKEMNTEEEEPSLSTLFRSLDPHTLHFLQIVIMTKRNTILCAIDVRIPSG